MLPFRIMYPHIGFLVGLFRLCGLCSAPPSRGRPLLLSCAPGASTPLRPHSHWSSSGLLALVFWEVLRFLGHVLSF